MAKQIKNEMPHTLEAEQALLGCLLIDGDIQLEILSEGLAIIPTKWDTEILCWEFKGKVDGSEFLVYINAENGKEQDVLVIKDTPDGVLTM